MGSSIRHFDGADVKMNFLFQGRELGGTKIEDFSSCLEAVGKDQRQRLV